MVYFKKSFAKCLCGGIKITIKGTLRSVINCHCYQCMKTHGNFAAYSSCKLQDISFFSDNTLRWYQSSKTSKRGFCNKCGASVFFKRLDSVNISISAGMFTNPTKLKTSHHIFIKGKMDFYRLDKSLPKYNKYSK